MVSGIPSAVKEEYERREWPRLRVALPASVTTASQDFNAKLVNIERCGAMLETAAVVEAGSRVMLRCGTIDAEATVIWAESGGVGIRLLTRLTDSQIAEQLSRSAAMAARRAKSVT